MLKQLDTLIGFAVVMSVVSLLITSITQMISSVLGLRGGNLVDALQVMIMKLDSSIGQDLAQKLAEEVLTRPVISDSVISMSTKFWDKVPILKALRKRWKVASAIRPDELLGILKDIAGVAPDEAQAALKNLQTAVPPGTSETRVPALKLLAALHVTTPGATAAIAALTTQLQKLPLPSAGRTQVQELINQLNDASDIALGNLSKWFNSAQDRAQQWFAMHTRIWTVVVAVLMALALQLDAFQLITQLSTDSELRAKLVGMSDTIRNEADRVFTNSVSPAAINQAALQQLRGAVLRDKLLERRATWRATGEPREARGCAELADIPSGNEQSAPKRFRRQNRSTR